MKKFPSLKNNLREKELCILTLFLKGYDFKNISITLKMSKSLISNYIYGAKYRKSLYDIMCIIPKEEIGIERVLLREKYKKITKKYTDWEQKVTIKEKNIIELWMEGYETNEIANIVKLPLNSIRCSIYGRDQIRRDSIFNQIKFSH
ncbi:MAG: hypothetical protein LIR50_17540 [Bacillota bacterium]|nr:hypothetical protein [Bacillota bacterium]